MAQMKPTILRAIAVVTTTFGFPLAARRRHHRTGVTKPGQEPMKAIAARPRFVAEPQPLPSSLKSLDHLAQHIGAIGKGAQLPNLSRTIHRPPQR